MAKCSFETRAVHAGEDPNAAYGALSQPISQSSVYALPDAEQGAAIHVGEQPGFFYGRMGTPTQATLEAAIAELEEGEACLATASGMAAISLVLLSLLESGDQVIVPESLYATTADLLDNFIEPLGVDVTRVDATDPQAIKSAICSASKVIYLETPSNPTLCLSDIAQVAALADSAGATLVVDSTFASPFNQRPLALGADVVVHSATKFLGGHGDLVAGALVGSRELINRARWDKMRILGPVISPFSAWLVLRGLKTLPVRMERHNSTALKIATFLENHTMVKSVHYPGLASHPQHELARRQMRGFGGVLSFELESAEAARRVVNRVELCTLAVSLGDVATLIQHSSSMTQKSLGKSQNQTSDVSAGLIRLSVGLEAVEDIAKDLERALDGL